MSLFPRTARLTHRAEFDFVFNAPDQCSSDRHFTVLARARVEDVTASFRLGMVVAKKRIAKAHERNRVKRQIRESFRRQRFSCAPVDIIVLPKTPAADATRGELKRSLERHWRKICRF